MIESTLEHARERGRSLFATVFSHAGGARTRRRKVAQELRIARFETQQRIGDTHTHRVERVATAKIRNSWFYVVYTIEHTEKRCVGVWHKFRLLGRAENVAQRRRRGLGVDARQRLTPTGTKRRWRIRVADIGEVAHRKLTGPNV